MLSEIRKPRKISTTENSFTYQSLQLFMPLMGRIRPFGDDPDH
jgi:hypothetical protein